MLGWPYLLPKRVRLYSYEWLVSADHWALLSFASRIRKGWLFLRVWAARTPGSGASALSEDGLHCPHQLRVRRLDLQPASPAFMLLPPLLPAPGLPSCTSLPVLTVSPARAATTPRACAQDAGLLFSRLLPHVPDGLDSVRSAHQSRVCSCLPPSLPQGRCRLHLVSLCSGVVAAQLRMLAALQMCTCTYFSTSGFYSCL